MNLTRLLRNPSPARWSKGLWSVLKLYRKLLSAAIKARMEYRFDFLSSLFIQAAMGAYDFLFIAVMLWRFGNIRGWNIYEVALLFAVSRLAFGLYRTFFSELDRFEYYMVSGDFDALLIRPWPSLLVLLSKDFDLTRINWSIQGMALGSYAVWGLVRQGVLTPLELAYLPVAVAESICLFVAVSLATSACAFWIVRIEELKVFTMNAPSSAALYHWISFPGC